MRGEKKSRFLRTAALGLGLAVVAIFTVLPSAAAQAPQPTAGAAATSADIDLSSVPKIKSYLRSLGVDSTGVVIQRGAKNYAGPNCPSVSWNCTTARSVVQIAVAVSDDDEPENRFVCKRAGTGTNKATNTCMIVQPGPNSNNSATCDIETYQAEGTITQTCFITQTGRRNSAFARQVAGMSASGTDQDVFQTISVKQTSTGTGGNTLETAQSALLRSHGASDNPVTQDVHQTTCGNQNAAGAGPNFVRARQSQILVVQKDGAGSVNIEQNNVPDLAECSGPAIPFPATFHPDTSDCAVDAFSPAKESANACTRIHQTSGSGRNTIHLGQLDSLLADVDDTTGDVTIVQGNPSEFTDPNQTGTDATLDQESSGLSQIFDEGLTTQFAVLENTGGFFLVDQTDVGPRCCAGGDQESNLGNDFSIKGRLIQRVFVDGALAEDPLPGGEFEQTGKVYGDCETSGDPEMGGGCTVDLTASNNADSESVHEGPAMSVHEQVRCTAFGGGGEIAIQQAAGFCSSASD